MIVAIALLLWAHLEHGRCGVLRCTFDALALVAAPASTGDGGRVGTGRVGTGRGGGEESGMVVAMIFGQ